MTQPFRILRFKQGVKPVTIGYATKKARDKGGQRYADKDGYVVGAEEMREHQWWLTGEFEPAACTHENTTWGVQQFPMGPPRAIGKCNDCGAHKSEVME